MTRPDLGVRQTATNEGQHLAVSVCQDVKVRAGCPEASRFGFDRHGSPRVVTVAHQGHGIGIVAGIAIASVALARTAPIAAATT